MSEIIFETSENQEISFPIAQGVKGEQGIQGSPGSGVKITQWVAGTYASGDQVNHIGKDWVSNAVTLSTDVPGISSKWVDRLSGYADNFDKLPTKNLFDKNTTTAAFINPQGEVSAIGNGALVSDFLPVLPDTDYFISGRVVGQDLATNGVAYYDANKVLIGIPPQGANWLAGLLNGIYHTTANTYFMRICVRYNGNENIDLVQVEKGSIATIYDDFTPVVSKINSAKIAANYIETTTGAKTISDFMASYADKASIDLVGEKIIYNQDNENYGFETVPLDGEWFIAPDNSRYVLENNSYLTGLGIVRSLYCPQGGSRVILYKKDYASVLDGKYVQFLFFVKTTDITKFNFSTSQYFCSPTNDSPTGYINDSVEVVTTVVSTGIYSVRVSARVPLTGNITKIWIGANISDGTEASAEMTLSGFYSYVSDESMAGKQVVTTVLPLVYQEILANKKLIEVNKLLSDANSFYRNPRLYSKKWHTLGDSITATNTYGYNFVLVARYAMVHGNYGISGTKLGGTDSDSMVNRFGTMSNDADIITVYGGTNDKTQGLAIGTFSDTTNATFYGSLHLICQGLIDKYPTKKIGFITPMQTTASDGTLPYVDAIIAVCANYAIPVLDLYRKGGISRQESQRAALIADYIHPNATGHALLADKVESFLLSL